MISRSYRATQSPAADLQVPERRRLPRRLDVPVRGQLQRPLLPERGQAGADDRRNVAGRRHRPRLPHHHRHLDSRRTLHLLEEEAGTVSSLLMHYILLKFRNYVILTYRSNFNCVQLRTLS